MEEFIYTKRSRDLVYHGQQLDSLLELKFILSVEETHAWIRDDLQIYYNINKQGLSNERSLHKYTPDFLIREWKTGDATLIEVKPDDYDNYWANRKRRKVSQRFIARFDYDWKFKIIYERDIKLSIAQLNKYKMIGDITNQSWFGNANQNNTSYSDEQFIHFVKCGFLSAA